MKPKSEFQRWRDYAIENRILVEMYKYFTNGQWIPPDMAHKILGAINLYRIPEVYSYPMGSSVVAQCHLYIHQDWEHVSVTLYGLDRTPTYKEITQIKELFWRDDEICIKIHPPKSQYVNTHPYCLHLWKKVSENYKEAQIIKDFISHFPQNSSSASFHTTLLNLNAQQYYIIAGPHRRPTWDEVCQFKKEYFDSKEAVVQYHFDMSTDLNQKFLLVLAPAPHPFPQRNFYSSNGKDDSH